MQKKYNDEISKASQEVRQLWKIPDTRKVNPVACVASAILANNRSELAKLKESTQSLIDAKKTLGLSTEQYSRASHVFLANLYACRAILSWVYSENNKGSQTLSFNDVKEVLGLTPESLYNAIHNCLDIDMARALMHGRDYACPLCGSKHE